MEKKSRANFICLNLVTGVLFMLGMGWGGGGMGGSET